MKTVPNEKKFDLSASGKSYTLITSEYMGTGLKFLIRGELHGSEKITLFVMGVPNPVMVYSHVRDTSGDAVVNYVYDAAVSAIKEYISGDEWKEGSVYYGELTEDGAFHITGTEKPEWDDGNWGQKVEF